MSGWSAVTGWAPLVAAGPGGAGVLGGGLAGALTGAVLGPLAAGLVRRAPQPGPWWAPWRPAGQAAAAVAGPVPVRLRVAVGAVAVVLCALAGAAATGAAGSHWPAAWPAFVLVGLAGAPLTVIDIRLHRLPDRLVAPTAVATVGLLALARLAGGGPLLQALVCGAAVLAVLGAVALALPRSLGLGDAKLGALLGLLLGWISVPAVVLGLFAGFALGALSSLALLAAGRARWTTAIALGPSLLTGALGAAAVLAL